MGPAPSSAIKGSFDSIKDEMSPPVKPNQSTQQEGTGAPSFYGCNLSCNPNSSPGSNGQLNYNCTMSCNPK